MTERAPLYDRLLVLLALLAPFALIVLTKWRSSLETTYAPMEPGMAQVFGATFETKAGTWLRETSSDGARLVLLVDRECPCTRSASAALESALAVSSRKDIALVVRDVADRGEGTSWEALVREIPATPTLLAVDHNELVYAGPVNAGSWCTTSVSQVLGVTALQAQGRGAVLNWLGEGCYCRMPGR